MRPSLSWTSDSVQQLRIMSVAARQFYSSRRIHIVKIRRDEEVSCMYIRKNRIKVVLFLIFCLAAYIPAVVFIPCTVQAEETEGDGGVEINPSELYARSAVLMDAGSGRILFAKNGRNEMPMASTTKIMTCILALEEGDPAETVSVSEAAASQPQVKLGMKSGQEFLLKDLLYSLMLESHNDSAVAVAEHVAGSVQGFADMMNRKAEEIGCDATYFITPNGLDAEDDNGIHHTTAEDLARIMKYCITDSVKKKDFLAITRTETYTFSDCDGTGSYTCNNHNTFLKMMEGALTGKTGFTADAGYCYVGALQRDGRTFIVSLLACGWPNNKGYKWADTKKLMTYGIDNFFYREISPKLPGDTIKVENGFGGGFPGKEPAEAGLRTGGGTQKLLMKRTEELEEELRLPEKVQAPVKEGDRLGELIYTLDGKTLAVYPVFASEDVGKRGMNVCLSYIAERFLFQ